MTRRTKADLFSELLSVTKQRNAAWDALSKIHKEHMRRRHIEPELGPSRCYPCELVAKGLGDVK